MFNSSFSIHKSTNFFEKIIAKLPPFCLLYCLFYKKAVLNEAKLAELRHTDSLLFIGGGAIPYTAMILSKYVKNVTVVDQDNCSSKIAKKLIKKMKLTNIVIENVKGEDLDTAPYSAIFIPLQAEPKEDILRNIRDKSCPHTKILMRIPKNSFKNVYTSLDQLPIKRYSYADIKQLTFDKVICFECGEILS